MFSKPKRNPGVDDHLPEYKSGEGEEFYHFDEFMGRDWDANSELPFIDTDRPTMPGFNPKYPHKISYKLNEKGFRSDAFGSSEEMPLAFFGCSVTAGFGVPNDACYVQQLFTRMKAEKILPANARHMNLGIGGSSIEHITTNAITYLRKYRPKAIFTLFPGTYRQMFYSPTQKRMQNYLPNVKAIKGEDLEWDAYMTVISHRRNCTIEHQKSLMLLDLLTKQMDVGWAWGYWDHSEDYSYLDTKPGGDRRVQQRFTHVDAGRDRHPGIDSHYAYASVCMSDPVFNKNVIQYLLRGRK